MRKNVIKGILYAILPFLFNVMFFTLGGVEHPASVWISYVWIHVAYFIMVATPLFTRKSQSAIIFRFTTRQISWAYFVVECIIGLIFIFIATDAIKAPIIIQLIPFCLFLLVFLWNILHDEHTSDNEHRQAIEVNFIKAAASKTKILMDNTSDETLKNRIEKLYDLIHSSPSKSYLSVKESENNIMIMLNELGVMLNENNIDEVNKLMCKIQSTMEERNRIVVLSN